MSEDGPVSQVLLESFRMGEGLLCHCFPAGYKEGMVRLESCAEFTDC